MFNCLFLLESKKKNQFPSFLDFSKIILWAIKMDWKNWFSNTQVHVCVPAGPDVCVCVTGVILGVSAVAQQVTSQLAIPTSHIGVWVWILTALLLTELPAAVSQGTPAGGAGLWPLPLTREARREFLACDLSQGLHRLSWLLGKQNASLYLSLPLTLLLSFQVDESKH